MAMNIDSVIKIVASVTGNDGIKKLGDNIAQVDKKTGGLSKAFGYLKVAVAVLVSGGALKGVINLGDELKTVSDRTAVSVETLSKFQGAAEKSGSSLESVGKALNKLSKSLSIKDENNKVLKSLGIDAKSSGEAMLQLADVFQRIEDPALKSALAIKLFGKSGAELIPMLQDGRKEIEANAAVMSGEFAEAADQFNDNLTDMKRGSQSFAAEAATPLVIAMNDIAEQLKGFGGDSFGVADFFGNVLAEALRLLALPLIKLNTLYLALGESIGFALAVSKAALKGNFAQIKAMASDYADIMVELDKKDQARIKALYKNSYFTKSDQPVMPSVAPSVEKPKPSSIDDTLKRLLSKPEDDQKWITKTNQETEALYKKADALNMSMLAQSMEAEKQKLLISGTEAQVGIAQIKEAQEKRLLAIAYERSRQFNKQLTDEKRGLDQEIAAIDESTRALGMNSREREISAINIKYENLLREKSIGLTTAEIAKQKELLDAARQAELNATQRRQDAKSDPALGAKQAINDFGDNVKDVAGQTKEVFTNAFNGATDALVEFTTTGKMSFKSFAVDVLKDIQRMIVKQLLFNAISGIATSFFGGATSGASPSISNLELNIPASSIGGARALGGAVTGRTSYIVGENGPELFTPAQSGRITANNRLGGGDTNINVYVSESGQASTSENGDSAKLGKLIAAAVQSEIVRQKRQGGLLAA